ncbi:hypothetical protein PROFUN_10932 [Planoprotostelium fungivorum]|uniref:Beta-xylosidase C-terminal Concanavalin A-like domain-containing protein n=1 Tax=Planoprotostelium fungivorum TaxID=1890364 RepID=A0A2P6NC35_9EUKA|nr:hypothetical protein PROFUN_10932 [Planoprotostelium fungivorum]
MTSFSELFPSDPKIIKDITREGEIVTLRVQPNTDLYHSPTISATNAPELTTHVEHFQRASVTVSGNWTLLYDQGGIVLWLGKRWIKAGVEFVNGHANISSVATVDGHSDWALMPFEGQRVRIELARDEEGSGVWVGLIKEDGSNIALRHVTGFFDGKDTEVPSVGVYAARPKDGDDTPLTVKFEQWELHQSS